MTRPASKREGGRVGSVERGSAAGGEKARAAGGVERGDVATVPELWDADPRAVLRGDAPSGRGSPLVRAMGASFLEMHAGSGSRHDCERPPPPPAAASVSSPRPRPSFPFQLERVQRKLGDLHGTDVVALRRAHRSLAQHALALQGEFSAANDACEEIRGTFREVVLNPAFVSSQLGWAAALALLAAVLQTAARAALGRGPPGAGSVSAPGSASGGLSLGGALGGAALLLTSALGGGSREASSSVRVSPRDFSGHAGGYAPVASAPGVSAPALVAPARAARSSLDLTRGIWLAAGSAVAVRGLAAFAARWVRLARENARATARLRRAMAVAGERVAIMGALSENAHLVGAAGEGEEQRLRSGPEAEAALASAALVPAASLGAPLRAGPSSSSSMADRDDGAPLGRHSSLPRGGLGTGRTAAAALGEPSASGALSAAPRRSRRASARDLGAVGASSSPPPLASNAFSSSIESLARVGAGDRVVTFDGGASLPSGTPRRRRSSGAHARSTSLPVESTLEARAQDLSPLEAWGAFAGMASRPAVERGSRSQLHGQRERHARDAFDAAARTPHGHARGGVASSSRHAAEEDAEAAGRMPGEGARTAPRNAAPASSSTPPPPQPRARARRAAYGAGGPISARTINADGPISARAINADGPISARAVNFDGSPVSARAVGAKLAVPPSVFSSLERFSPPRRAGPAPSPRSARDLPGSDSGASSGSVQIARDRLRREERTNAPDSEEGDEGEVFELLGHYARLGGGRRG